MNELTNDRLTEHAIALRTVSDRTAREIVEIGRRLIDARKACGYGQWLSWLETEFGLKTRSAYNFMNVAKAATRWPQFVDLNVPIYALYLLAGPRTPDEVIKAIAKHGERLSLMEVQEMIDAATNKKRQTTEEKTAKLIAKQDALRTKLKRDKNALATLSDRIRVLSKA